MSDQDRIAVLKAWYRQLPGRVPELAKLNTQSWTQVSGDASFRAYFRGGDATRSVILMDAPPEREATRPFLDICETLRKAGVRVPVVFAADTDQGFVCLEDFGDSLMLDSLRQASDDTDPSTVEALYRAAFRQLQAIQGADTAGLPEYDEALLQREMALFRDWLCEGLLDLRLSVRERDVMQRCFDQLARVALAQPRVLVHRDYHSRNLMLLEEGGPGVLDFQDAVNGPLTYDLVSLLKDCYIAWPRSRVREWVLDWHGQAGQAAGADREAFWRDFELMGVQRHLKAAGIFARLFLRDGKPGYLEDIPRTVGYMLELGKDYDDVPGYRDFRLWLEGRFQPALQAWRSGRGAIQP